MPQAISYMRFSATHQGKGSTFERQGEYIDRWLKNHPDFKLSTLSANDKGRSAYKGDHLNHGLGRIIASIKCGDIKKGDFILVEAVDRIGRLEPMDMIMLINRIVETGVTIVTLEDNTEYSLESLNKDSGALFILIGKVQQAHNYSKNLSDRISAAYESKRRKARNGEAITLAPPIWLTSDGQLIPEYAKMVSACIDKYLNGYSANSILNILGDRFPHLKDTHPETLKRWFRSRRLIGEWENKGDFIQSVFQPLIDTDTFYKLQRELDRRYKYMSPPTTYDLSGLVVCEACGARYYFRRKKHKDYTITYANCSTYLKRGKTHCNNSKTWPYEVLKAIYEESQPYLLVNKSMKDSSLKYTDRLDTLKAQLAEKNAQEKALIDVLVDAPGSQNIKDRIANTSAGIQSLKLEIAKLEEFTSKDENILQYDRAEATKILRQADSDPVYKRKILLSAGYNISIKGNIATAYKSQDWPTHYTLVKRSTKYNCYFVTAETEQESIDMDEMITQLQKQGMMIDRAAIPQNMVRHQYAVHRNRAILLTHCYEVQDIENSLEEMLNNDPNLFEAAPEKELDFGPYLT